MFHIGPSVALSATLLLCSFYGKRWLERFQTKYRENLVFLKNHSYFQDQCENSLFRQHVPEYSSLCREIVEFKHIGVFTKTLLEMTHIQYLKQWYLMILRSPRYIWIILLLWSFLVLYLRMRWMRARKIHIPFFQHPI